MALIADLANLLLRKDLVLLWFYSLRPRILQKFTWSNGSGPSTWISQAMPRSQDVPFGSAMTLQPPSVMLLAKEHRVCDLRPLRGLKVPPINMVPGQHHSFSGASGGSSGVHASHSETTGSPSLGSSGLVSGRLILRQLSVSLFRWVKRSWWLSVHDLEIHVKFLNVLDCSVNFINGLWPRSSGSFWGPEESDVKFLNLLDCLVNSFNELWPRSSGSLLGPRGLRCEVPQPSRLSLNFFNGLRPPLPWPPCGAQRTQM